MKTKLFVLLPLLLALIIAVGVAVFHEPPAAVCDVHTFGEWRGTQAPSCAEGGTDTRICTVCGVSETRPVNAIGHVFGDWTTITIADCETAGVETRICVVCGEAEEHILDALGHDEIPHDAQAPTCTESGWDAYVTCSRCDYTSYVEKAALGHDEIVHDAQEPTCTESGWFAYVTCTRCDYNTCETMAALGHDEIPHDAQAPTCTESGWDAYVTCTRCDYSTYEEEAALDHDFAEDWSYTAEYHYHACTHANCTEKVDVAEHIYDTVSGETCDICGAVRVMSCDHPTTETVPGHPATCTETGLTDGTQCTVCGVMVALQETIDALGHDEIEHEAQQPTCTEIGWDAYVTCTRCDYTTYAETPASGHIYTTTEVPSTETENGYILYECQNCDYSYKEDLLAIGSNGLSYTLNSDGTAYFVSHIGTCLDTHIVIPAVYEGLPVTGIGAQAFYGCSNLVSVKIPDSVTYIGESAFRGCSKLESMTIPAGVTSIGTYAFYSCTVLTNVTFENIYGWYVTNTEGAAEGTIVAVMDPSRNATRLRSTYHRYVWYSTGICEHDLTEYAAQAPTHTEIGWNAYEACSRCDYTTYEELPALLTFEKIESGYQVTGYTGSIDVVEIPDMYQGEPILWIAERAFYQCEGLTVVTIPACVMGIGDYAFYGCTNLTRVVFSEDSQLIDMGEGVFEECENLEDLQLPGSSDDPNVPPVGSEVGYTCPIVDIALLNGEGTFSLADNVGKVTVLNFWGTWCGPCVEELLYFDEIATEYADSVTVVAIHSYIAIAQAPQFVEAYYTDSDILFGGDGEDEAYCVQLGGGQFWPMTVIVDANGVITAKQIGALTYNQIKALIDAALGV